MPSPSDDLRALQNIYRARWQKHGSSQLSLGWTKGKQQLRFDVLLSGLSCEGKSFLDVGCGFGDLNIAISLRASHYQYLGIDMVPEFIQEAEKKYKTSSVSFVQGDFASLLLSSNFDYIVASGIFGYRMTHVDNYSYIRHVLGKMLDACNEAVAVDFLSDRVNFKRDQNFYASPETILATCMSLTKNVRLFHDYMPFEFSVVLYKDDSFDESDTVFNVRSNAR